MERFGMFQFLKTLLSPPEQPAENGGAQTQEKEEKTPPNDGTFNGEIVDSGFENPSNAYLEFARAHDARARRTKK